MSRIASRPDQRWTVATARPHRQPQALVDVGGGDDLEAGEHHGRGGKPHLEVDRVREEELQVARRVEARRERVVLGDDADGQRHEREDDERRGQPEPVRAGGVGRNCHGRDHRRGLGFGACRPTGHLSLLTVGQLRARSDQAKADRRLQILGCAAAVCAAVGLRGADRGRRGGSGRGRQGHGLSLLPDQGGPRRGAGRHSTSRAGPTTSTAASPASRGRPRPTSRPGSWSSRSPGGATCSRSPRAGSSRPRRSTTHPPRRRSSARSRTWARAAAAA